MKDGADARPATEADLQESEDALIKSVAQMHEGVILALVSICATVAAKGGASYDEFITALRGTSEGMLKERQPQLTHYPVDKLMKYLEQLRDGDDVRPPRH